MRNVILKAASTLLLACWAMMPVYGQTTSWNGGVGSGDWEVASNWSGGIPDSTKNTSISTITASQTVSITAGTSAETNNFTLQFGKLDIADTASLVINGDASLTSSSSVSGDGDLTVLGNTTWDLFNISGNGSLTFESTLNLNRLVSGTDIANRTVFTNGATNWNDDQSIFALTDVEWNNSGVMTRNLGGTFADRNFQLGSGSVFNNSGEFIKTGDNANFQVIGGTFNNSGTVSSSGGGIEFTGAFNNTLGSLVIADGGNVTFSGDFTNDGGTLRAVGGNSISLDAYTHNDGVLMVDGGSIGANAMNIVAGGVAGVGTLVSNVDMASGTYLAPGNSAGELTIDGNLSMAGGSQFLLELGGTSVGEFDVLNVLGDVNIGDDAELLVSFIDGFTPTVGNTFEFLNFDGSAVGENWVVTFDTPGYMGDVILNGGSGSSYSLSISAVPEPSSIALLVGIAGTLEFRRRRRAKSSPVVQLA